MVRNWIWDNWHKNGINPLTSFNGHFGNEPKNDLRYIAWKINKNSATKKNIDTNFHWFLFANINNNNIKNLLSFIQKISYHFTLKWWAHKRSLLMLLSCQFLFGRQLNRILKSKFLSKIVIKRLVKMIFRATKHLKTASSSGFSNIFRLKHVSFLTFLSFKQ